MELELRPAPAVHWGDNESTGYRHVGIFNGADKIFACVSHKCMGKWKSSLIPMGYSYSRDEAHDLYQLFGKIDALMNYLEIDDELSHDEIISYLEITNDND